MKKINLGNYIVPVETVNGICIDIGANLGDFTNKYTNHFKEIYYFEAQTKLYNELQERFKEKPNLLGYNKAVWSTSNEILKLVSHKNNDMGSTGVKSELLNDGWSDEIVNEIESISLIDLLKTIPHDIIDYLKIDCETSEYPFFINNDLSMFKYIGIELHCHLGLERYTELLNWINKTHVLTQGDTAFNPILNKEVLYKLK
jgi:FkbM family methyltransferase